MARLPRLCGESGRRVFGALVEPRCKPFQGVDQSWSRPIEHLISINEHDCIREFPARMVGTRALNCGKFPPPFGAFERCHSGTDSRQRKSAGRHHNAFGCTGNDLCGGSDSALATNGIEGVKAAGEGDEFGCPVTTYKRWIGPFKKQH